MIHTWTVRIEQADGGDVEAVIYQDGRMIAEAAVTPDGISVDRARSMAIMLAAMKVEGRPDIA